MHEACSDSETERVGPALLPPTEWHAGACRVDELCRLDAECLTPEVDLLDALSASVRANALAAALARIVRALEDGLGFLREVERAKP